MEELCSSQKFHIPTPVHVSCCIVHCALLEYKTVTWYWETFFVLWALTECWCVSITRTKLMRLSRWTCGRDVYWRCTCVHVWTPITAQTSSVAFFFCRKEYVKQLVSTVQKHALDGINVQHAKLKDANFKNFILRLRKALKQANSNYLLSIVWVFCPNCMHSYDTAHALVNYVDYFVAVMYYMHKCTGKYKGYCTPCSVDSLSDVKRYSEQWVAIDIPKKKTVITFGWYGFKTQCKRYTHEDSKCYANCDVKDFTSRLVRHRCIDDSCFLLTWKIILFSMNKRIG